ncbi:hypothetical protein DPMN_152082 [Dreissena polymorpha]|uniref:Uncharacterized protein n=1 Tax=Dreissena polymorpha TaxID=45954 RepID=A0A9D4FMD8_DREPO|nr:hypothetical protein DPMN_152082 [Dreissena polymorpha]
MYVTMIVLLVLPSDGLILLMYMYINRDLPLHWFILDIIDAFVGIVAVMLLLVILFRPLLSMFQHCNAPEIPENYASFENASNEQMPASEGAVHLIINTPLTGGEMTVAHAYAMAQQTFPYRPDIG